MKNRFKINLNTRLYPRLVSKKDERLLLKWANDPIVRQNAFNSKKISEKVHRQWLHSQLKDKKNCKFYIVETKNKIPIGQVRLDKRQDKWFINFSLAKFARGKKIGSILLETIFKKFNFNKKVEFIAEVKKGNLASCRVFEKIGFIRDFVNKQKIVFKYNLKKNFMVIGGGFGQVPAILAAKKLGLNVIVVDRDLNGAGMKLADLPLNIDVLDIKSIVRAAKKYSVVGALTMQSDIGIPAVGAVVDNLRLKGSGKKIAMKCSNKILMRKAFEKFKIPQPKFRIITTIEEAFEAVNQIGFPCVVKAPDSSASRGIVRVNNIKELQNAFYEASKYSRVKRILIEEFIEGLEFGAQTFSINGKCIKVLIHDDEMSSPPYMIPVAHSFPSTLPKESLLKANKAIKDCIEALGVSDGPSNVDVIFDKYGNPKIIEVGARIGATCLPELVLYHTGIDFTRAAIQVACGIKPNLTSKKLQPCAAFILFSKKNGLMKNYHISRHFKHHPNILEWEVTATPGSRVSILKKGTDRIGKVVVKGNTSFEALNLARDFCLAFKLDVYKNKRSQ